VFSQNFYYAVISTNSREFKIMEFEKKTDPDHKDDLNFLPFRPLEVQFFSSASSVMVLVPTCYFTVTFNEQNMGFFSLLCIIINGVSFHLQTLLAFTLMSYISPVTYSVCNTLKRAVLIWYVYLSDFL
jgi:hypothetical protein